MEKTVDELMAENLASQYFGKQEEVKTEAPAVTEPVVTETPAAEVPVVEAKTEPVVEQKVDAPVVEPVKTFEELLAEKTGGKFSKWEDIEKELTPKEVFANEQIKHLNELAAKGIDVTSKEFLELQSANFEKLDKVEDILFEKWKRSEDGEGLSEKTIRRDINRKYNVDEWIDKVDADLTDDDIANREKMQRDALKAKDWLVNYKNERVLVKQPDPAQVEAMAKQREANLKNWDSFVESNIVNKITKLSSPISYKDETGKVVESTVDSELSEQDRREVAEIMKQLPRDSNAFFSQFKDKDGNPNHEALALMMLKAKAYDKAVAKSYTTGAEQRALLIEKQSKNTNFKPSESQVQGKVFKTTDEAMRDAIAKMKI